MKTAYIKHNEAPLEALIPTLRNSTWGFRMYKVLGITAGASCRHRRWSSPWEHPVLGPSSSQRSLCFAFPSSPCSRNSSRPGTCYHLGLGFGVWVQGLGFRGERGNTRLLLSSSVLYGSSWHVPTFRSGARKGMSSNDPLITIESC